MKILKFILSVAALPFLLINCTLNKALIKDCTLKEVSVETGNINENLYTKNTDGGFHFKDNAMGRISPMLGQKRLSADSKCPPNNAYQDNKGNVYIFEEKEIPDQIKSLDKKLLCKLFIYAKWDSVKTYTLNLDAEICVDQLNFTIYMREKGDYVLRATTINGYKVYKYYNRFVVEDYKNFLRFHEYLRTNIVSENLFDRIDLDQTKFNMRYNITPVPTGKLNYNTLPQTSAGMTDKIYFESINPSNFSYRLRHIYIKHSDAVLNMYFCENQENCDLNRVTQVNCKYQRDENSYNNENSNNAWFEYLNKKVFPGYLEKTIKGYECDCKNRIINAYPGSKMNIKTFNFSFFEPLDSPPLPMTSNGSGGQ